MEKVSGWVGPNTGSLFSEARVRAMHYHSMIYGLGSFHILKHESFFYHNIFQIVKRNFKCVKAKRILPVPGKANISGFVMV